MRRHENSFGGEKPYGNGLLIRGNGLLIRGNGLLIRGNGLLILSPSHDRTPSTLDGELEVMELTLHFPSHPMP